MPRRRPSRFLPPPVLSGYLSGLALAAMLVFAAEAVSAAYVEPPFLAEKVAKGELPPVSERVPQAPFVVNFEREGTALGRYGGALRLLMGRGKDIRMMVVYGYARLVGYDRDLNIVADILESYEVEAGRTFTLKIRKGHKWSDGHPFTAEDFRYYWEDMALNQEISPLGAPQIFKVDDQPPKFEVLDELTVRFSWHKPNPFFLPALAAAAPLYIYRPAHYLKQFHARYVDADTLEAQVEEAKKRNWRALHFSRDRQYRNDNPMMPSLQPWVLQTPPPSDRFVFMRNPYYHRVDEKGHQLPYIDRAIVTIANAKLIAAKTGSGEADLQARAIQFKNYTFLKRGEKRNNFKVRSWLSAKGSQMALYPNLNATDPVWRDLLRKADFRRALSLAIDRHEINQVIFFGLALETNNIVLPMSPLYKPEYKTKWATYDVKRANVLLNKLGLTKRDENGIRLLPDGRPMEIIVETAGEDSDQADILELIADSWKKIGVKLFTKPTRREVLRRRVLAGSTIMSVWFGLENGVPTAQSSPVELVPAREDQLQWPKWGLYRQSGGKGGEAVDMDVVKRLIELNERWIGSPDAETRTAIWREMLDIHAEEMFSIGIVAGVVQPVVVSNALRNVPEKGIYNWDPGAHFGIYRPDTFWFEDK